jgi:AmiR/NasT family two-component response regulator
MAIEKRVLLARPHAFIVSQMRPFLLDAGYTPVGVQDLVELDDQLVTPLKGAIISTAVTSTIDADASAVFRMVRQKQPRLPIVFAGMADAATMKVVAERAVAEMVSGPIVVGPGGYRAGADRSSTFLILRKDDLLSAASIELATRALRSHLG